MVIFCFPIVISDTADPNPFQETSYESNFSDKLRVDSDRSEGLDH